MTFIFAGQKIPIHPLDTNIDLNLTNASGDKVCVGAVSTRSPSPRSAATHRHRSISPLAPQLMTITTSSLECPSVCTPCLPPPFFAHSFRTVRNVYILIDYGDFVDGTSSTADPYIQLLATTDDLSEAHQDFVKVRMGGKDDANWQLLPPSSTGSPPKSESQFVRKIKYYWPIIAGVAGFLILVILISCLCMRRRKKRGAGPFWRGKKSYRQLNEPAPLGMHTLGKDGAPRHSVSDYQNPWDSRH